MIINGQTEFLTLMGDPIRSVKSPMIYNPHLRKQSINTVLIPVEVSTENFANVFNAMIQIHNFKGSLVTMPHKVAAVTLADELSVTAQVAGSCNALKLSSDGKVVGDMFDGEGFVRGIKRKGFDPKDKKAIVIGSGGVGRAIAASLAGAGVSTLCLSDLNIDSCKSLAQRLKTHYPTLEVVFGLENVGTYDLVVNATPLGMKENDPLPMDISQLQSHHFVGEVVMKSDITPFLQAAKAKGCQIQVGTDMLFEQIPAYLEFFDLPTITVEEARTLAEIQYL